MPRQNKPKVTIGPDGTIHVDDDNHKAAESVPAAPDKGKSNGMKTTSKSNRADSAKYNGSKQAGRSSHKQKPAPASQEATKAPYWVFQRERGKVLNLIRSLTGS